VVVSATDAFSVSTSVSAAATSLVSMTTSDESMTMVTSSDHQFTTTDPSTETGTDTADSTAFIIIGTTAGVLVLSLTLIVIVVAFRARAQSSTAAKAAALAPTSYRRPRGPGPRGTRMLNLDRGRVPLYGDKKKSDTKNKFGRQKATAVSNRMTYRCAILLRVSTHDHRTLAVRVMSTIVLSSILQLRAAQWPLWLTTTLDLTIN